jgi:hypothetical protein
MNGNCIPSGMTIPVQQIHGPVLLFHGQYDALWPVAYSEQISTELDSAVHPHSLVVFPNVGHTFGTLDCLIGTRTCTGVNSRLLVSVAWDAAANVIATRVMFAQVIALLRSEAAGTNLNLPTSVGLPAGLPTPTEPSPVPTPAGPPGAVLLEDTMQDPSSRALPTSSEPDQRSRGYVDGQYVMTVPADGGLKPGQTNQLVTSLPGSYAGAALSTDVRLVDPLADQYVALACRSQHPGSAYIFEVFPFSGRFGLTRWIETFAASFTGGLQTSSAIHTGGETNKLELRCQSQRVEGLINGVSVVSVADYTYQSGALWFGVGQASSPSTGGPLTTSGNIRAQFSSVLVTQQ